MAKILVVNDEKEVRDILKNILSKEGHKVFVANKGEEAIKKVNAYSPDLMILDVMIPGMDGYEICAEIRKSTFHSKLPILMISSENDPEYELKALRAGADDFITKPFNNSVLLTRIKVLFR